MISEELGIDNGEENPSYFIDLNWYERSGRSFPLLARACLCPTHRERLTPEDNPDALLEIIRNCCSKVEGFFNARLTVKELIFRLFLTNGDQPLELEEIAERFGEWKSKVSTQTLRRLLDNDSYYGLRQVSTLPQSEDKSPENLTNPPPPSPPSPQADLP